MANVVEYIKVGSGETWPIRDSEAHTLINEIWNTIYPVGSIYMSVVETSPASLFGGTWERIKDTFLLASGDTYEPGAVGGEASHTLTTEEIPPHKHSVFSTIENSSGDPFATGTNWYTVLTSDNLRAPGYSSNTSDVVAGVTNESGGGQPHNNMPPYLAVYVWKRTA